MNTFASKGQKSHQAEMEDVMGPCLRAKVIRGRLVEAVMWKSKEKIAKCLSNLYNLPPSKQMLTETGLSLLLADTSIWRAVDNDLELKAAKLLKLWKTACKDQTCAGAVAEKPWPCKSAADFVEVVDRWQTTILGELDFTDVTVVRDTAIQLSLRRMETEMDFLFLQDGEIAQWPEQKCEGGG